MNLALFDFDGTITKKDSLNEFLKFASTRSEYLLKMLTFLPIFLLYKTGFIKNDKAKQMLLKLFFKGWSKKKFEKKAKDFSLSVLDSILRDDLYSFLKEHKKRGDKVVIVSASMECWLKPWCQKEEVELISTRLKFEDGRFGGEFLTKNCYGKEKVVRIKEVYDLKLFEKVYAYGDSKADRYMFELADEWRYV